VSEFDLLDDLKSELFGGQYLKHLEDKKAAATADSQLLSDYERTFGTDYGRRVLMDIIATGKVFHTTFTGNAWANFFEGFRAFALYIIHMSTRNKYLKQNEVREHERNKAKKK
jgi:hypothetical protein